MKVYVVNVCDWDDYMDSEYDRIDSIWTDKKSALIRIWHIVNEIIEQNWYEHEYLMPGLDYKLEYEYYIPNFSNKENERAVFDFGCEGTSINVNEFEMNPLDDDLPAYFTTTYVED